MHGVDLFRIEFIAARRTGVLSNRAGDDHRRLLRQRGGTRKRFFSNHGLTDDGLDIACPVSDNEKVQLSTRALVSQPTTNGHVLTNISGYVLYRDNRRHSLLHHAYF